MHATTRVVLHEELRPRTFDVICAGGASWKLASAGGAFASSSPRSPRVPLRPSGGAVDVALALAKEGLRVGLASVFSDDDFGRASRERIAALGVDVDGVLLARARSGVMLVDAGGGASAVPSDDEASPPLEVPPAWASQLLLLSGLSPVVAHAAALCKAARAARREGALVLLDFDASLHVWAGREPRTVRMVLREVDVARCSLADLAVLAVDVAEVRAALRPGATLVVSDGAGGIVATGPFGEVAVAPPDATSARPTGRGDALTAALCAELTRPGEPGESPSARWHRALRRGQAAAAGAAIGSASSIRTAR
jgi:sugar/nucleoside kinase (ribokinase family)